MRGQLLGRRRMRPRLARRALAGDDGGHDQPAGFRARVQQHGGLTAADQLEVDLAEKLGIEQGAVQNRGKHASSLLLLKRLIKEGAPIHGVGIQGHWSLNTRIPDVEKAIENYASLGLKVSISELDVTATGSNTGAFGNQGGGAVTAEALEQQAQVYAKLFDVFNRHAKSISRVTFWGISDRRSWRGRQRPLLFDAQLQPKPALQAILNVSKEK